MAPVKLQAGLEIYDLMTALITVPAIEAEKQKIWTSALHFLSGLFEQDVMLFVLCSSYMPGLGFVPKFF